MANSIKISLSVFDWVSEGQEVGWGENIGFIFFKIYEQILLMVASTNDQSQTTRNVFKCCKMNSFRASPNLHD